MADPQINRPGSSQVPEPEAHPPHEPTIVSDCWQQMVQAVLGVVLLLGALAMVHYYLPTTAQVEPLQQDQAMPAVVLNRYRNSIGYIYGVYQVGFPNQRPVVRARVSGTGFLVGKALVA